MKIFVTGGAGYCGTVLSNLLVSNGHEVTVYDALFFGINRLDPKINVVQGDIRDSKLLEKTLPGHEMVVHLAAIANDASFELDDDLSTSINFDCFESLVKMSKKAKVKRFIYASSSSVYGISDEPEVTEEHPLVPLTLYNKFKGMCEPILLREGDANFETVVFRPATVFGSSPRMRFDLTVNILTNHAVANKIIRVFGGEQRRPNLHISDYALAVDSLLNADASLINGQIFNVGMANLTVSDIARKVRSIVAEISKINENEIKINFEASVDNRSYHINSDKIKHALGFVPKTSIEHGVAEMTSDLKSGKFPDSMEATHYYNVKQMLKLGIK